MRASSYGWDLRTVQLCRHPAARKGTSSVTNSDTIIITLCLSLSSAADRSLHSAISTDVIFSNDGLINSNNSRSATATIFFSATATALSAASTANAHACSQQQLAALKQAFTQKHIITLCSCFSIINLYYSNNKSRSSYHNNNSNTQTCCDYDAACVANDVQQLQHLPSLNQPQLYLHCYHTPTAVVLLISC